MPVLSRRELLSILSGGLVAGWSLSCKPSSGNDPIPVPEPSFRFLVASDGHLGEANTPSDQYFSDLISAVKAEHARSALQFVVVNGDLVHGDKPEQLPKVKAYLDTLPVPYYVTRGNHDRVTNDVWKSLWGYDTNHVVERTEATLILLDTSDQWGNYLCGDTAWLKKQVAAARTGLPVFLFMHIPYLRDLTGTTPCQDIQTVIADYPTIRAVFHGHDHTLDLGLMAGKTALLFDAHFGSSWGTPYRGYRVVEYKKEAYTYQYDFVNQKKVNEMTF